MVWAHLCARMADWSSDEEEAVRPPHHGWLYQVIHGQKVRMEGLVDADPTWPTPKPLCVCMLQYVLRLFFT